MNNLYIQKELTWTFCAPPTETVCPSQPERHNNQKRSLKASPVGVPLVIGDGERKTGKVCFSSVLLLSRVLTAFRKWNSLTMLQGFPFCVSNVCVYV